MGKFFKQPLNFILIYILLTGIVSAKFIPVKGVVEDVLLTSILVFPAISYFVYICKKNVKKFIAKIFEWPNQLIVLYLIWALVTLNYSIDKQTSFFYIVGGSVVFISGFVIVKDLFNKDWYSKILYSILVVGLLSALYTLVLLIVQIINPNIVSTFTIVNISLTDRFTLFNVPFLISYFKHPNTLGIILFLSLAASLSLLLVEKEKKYKQFLTISACTLLFTILFTFSRASMLAGLIFTSLIFIPALKRKQFLIPISALILLLAFSIFAVNRVGFRISSGNPRPFVKQVFLPDDSGLEAYEELAEEEDLFVPKKVSKRDLSGRNVIWNSSLEYIKDNPEFGAGFGNSPKAIKSGIPEIFSRFRGVTPHNTYLRTTVESGFVGLALYLALLISLLALFLKKWRKITVVEWTLVSLIVAILVYQVFETNFLLGTGFRSFYLLVLLAGGYSLLKKL